jgi:glycosyltransferase involved in cell wall biosynthesis
MLSSRTLVPHTVAVASRGPAPESERHSTEEAAVAFFSPVWPARSAANGIASYIENIVSGMPAIGPSPVVITASSQAGLRDPLVRQLTFPTNWWTRQLDRICFKIAGDIRFHRRMTSAIVRELAALGRRGPLDIVEMEESFGWSYEVGRGGPVPTVVRLHGPWFLMGPLVAAQGDSGFDRRVRLERLGIAHAAGVSAPSHDVLSRTRKHYGLELSDAVVIPNPVAECPAKARWRLQGCDRNQILFVGRFDGHKGGDTIIDAFVQVASRHPTARLTFVGPDRGFTDAAAKRWQIHDYIADRVGESPARERIEWLGQRTPEEINKLRRRAMVTVICSRYETFSMTAAEAMAQSCPIVATMAGGLSELIRDERNGLFCQPDDPVDLAEKILTMLDHPKIAATLGEQAAQDAVSRYHPRIIARQTLAFYHEVLARSACNRKRR